MNTPDNNRIPLGQQTRAYMCRGWVLRIWKDQSGKWTVSLLHFSTANRPPPNAKRIAAEWSPYHKRFGFLYELPARAKSLPRAFAALERMLAPNHKAKTDSLSLGATTAKLLERGADLCVWKIQGNWRARLFQVSFRTSPLWADASTPQAALDGLDKTLKNENPNRHGSLRESAK